MSSQFTTIALLPADKEALDEINDAEFDSEASYREVLLSLCALYEQHETGSLAGDNHEAYVVDRSPEPFHVTD